MVKKVAHLGIAVRRLEDALPFYRDVMGMKVAAETELPEMGLRIAILEAGDDRVELLEATAADSSIGRFLSRQGPGIHHVAFEVEDLEAALADLKGRGLRLIDEKPRVGARGHRIAFLHPEAAEGVLVELTEAPPSPK
jgi:methylmalonyl-CoA/ethylmalonyl-CoA epimerase